MSLINFKINNQKFTRSTLEYPVDMTLNEFIRSYAGLTGTKFMCREGDCGCCICVIKGKDSFTGEEFTKAVNSCLFLINSCNNLEILTVEGIGNRNNGYHQIQLRLAKGNASQCGYCSPGIVMNMYALLKTKPNLTREEIQNSFGGNLCRCTGYRPILDSMESFSSEFEYEFIDVCQDIEDLKLINGPCQKQNTNSCKNLCKKSYENIPELRKWYVASSLKDVFNILDKLPSRTSYTLIHGGTGQGVYQRPDNISTFIDINQISLLHEYSITPKQLKLGANMTLSSAIEIFEKSSRIPGFEYCEQLKNHFEMVANNPIRNVGSIAGNLLLKHANLHFVSDVFIVFEALQADVLIMDGNGKIEIVKPSQFLNVDMHKKIITEISLKSLTLNQYFFKSYKITPRTQNSQAYVNAAFVIKFSDVQTKLIQEAQLCFGGIADNFIHAKKTEQYLIGKKFNNLTSVIFEILNSDIHPQWILPDTSAVYRKQLAVDLFYKFHISNSLNINNRFKSGGTILKRGLSQGSQNFDTIKENYPLTQPVIKLEALNQCSGEAKYFNDYPYNSSDLWAVFVRASHVNSKISQIDASEALQLPGVAGFFSAKHVPALNSFTPTGFYFYYIEDEPIFADSTILYYDQPIGVVVAITLELAEKAAKKVKIFYERQEKIVNINLKEVVKKKCLPSENIKKNNIKKQTSDSFDLGSQYHFTMEPHTTVCVPTEDGMQLYCSTQFTDFTQIAVAKCLGLQQNSIEISVRRVGGAYGSKESRSNQVACAAAIACHYLNRTIRFVMSIESMLRCVGKRHAFHADYQFEAENNGKVRDYSASFFSDGGWGKNENFIADKTLKAWPSCYDVSTNWNVNGELVNTDAPANTWMRAPGTLEAINLTENLMEHIAWATKQDPVNVRIANISNNSKMKTLLPAFISNVEYAKRLINVDKFNSENRWKKKGLGIAIMEYPMIYFGIYPAEVVIYHSDGTVAISHGGIEVGQGMNTKVAQVAAYTLNIPLNLIKVYPSNTFVGANSSVTGASVTAECVCFATQKACQELLTRLAVIKNQMNNPSWLELITNAFSKGIDLRALGEMVPSDLKEYSVDGLACSEVEVDILTGNVIISRVDILEDTGQSLSPLIDVGQVEGAFVMGLGYWLTEHLIYKNSTGELLTNRAWYYKIPGAQDIPIDFRVNLLQKSSNSGGFLRSKASGEPAICLAISAVHAIRRALESARSDAGLPRQWIKLDAPTTPETILLLSGTTINSLKL